MEEEDVVLVVEEEVVDVGVALPEDEEVVAVVDAEVEEEEDVEMVVEVEEVVGEVDEEAVGVVWQVVPKF